MTLEKFKQNLKVIGDKIYSYNTHVADINHYHGTVYIKGYWSVTTSKHINYVARKLNYKTQA